MKRVLWGIISGVFIVIIFLWVIGKYVLSFSVAQYEGDVRVVDLQAEVEITFDQKGIPQIWAENDDDLFFAVGWVHASERLFQMELIRRLAQGRLSELFGEATYKTDLYQRKIGFARKAEAELAELTTAELNILKKYCQGINRWIDSKAILPPEFELLMFEPEPWQPVDCLTILLYQTWFSHALMDKDRSYALLIEELGDDVLNLIKKYKEWSPPTVHESFLETIFSDTDFPLRMTEASNSWVVAPQKSASGSAVHASDPHLVINQIPGFWYILGARSQQGLNVLGVTVPGLPFVSMGHNGRICFAFTVASVDVIDYYKYDRDPDDFVQVYGPQGPEYLKERDVKIKIEGEGWKSETVLATSIGPVIEEDSTSVTVLKWVGFDFSVAGILRSGLALQSAGDFEAFRKAVTGLGALDANWTYSDARGNIGYQLGVPIPKRKFNNTYSLLNAGNPDTHWRGYYELDKTPYLFNPSAGWVASCNNQIVSEKWPFDIPGFYDPYRIVRATQLLNSEEEFSARKVGEFQLDDISAVALRWKAFCAAGAEYAGEKHLAGEIAKWDGRMNTESRIAALFSYWWQFLSEPLFREELGESWRLGSYIKEKVLSARIPKSMDDFSEADIDISAQAFTYALKIVEGRSYGDVSKLSIEHPLSRVKLLDLWLDLNRGPFEFPGDRGTLNVNYNRFDEKEQKFRTIVGPSMRFVLDWSDIDAFTINVFMGQSGNPLSVHYDDFLKMSFAGERWNVPFSKNKVYEKKAWLLRLHP